MRKWLTAAILLLAQAAVAHPLTPLSAAEIRAAARIFRDSGRMSGTSRFSLLTLDEPPKDAVRQNLPVSRRAFAVIYDRMSDKTSEAIADLTAGKLASWKEIPGAEPPVDGADSEIAGRIARADSRWVQALRARGISDPESVVTVAWPAGYFALPFDTPGRIVRVTPYYAAGRNYDAHPVEGIAVHVNLTTGKVLNFVDIDRNAPVSRENADLGPADTMPHRAPPAPLEIRQPNAGFQIEDGEVRWQKWRFRYALHPRTGLVLYTAGYEDGGKVRPILYRASLSEMAVPYGDPSGAWFFRNTFDAGELGLGVLATGMRPGVDCPQNCAVYDAVVAMETGDPRTIRGAVALYERDTRVAWKHGDDARRARDLVLAYSSQAGNYDYGFEWIFHQDGALEARVLLTGVMSVKGVAVGAHEATGHLVAKNLAAVHHQHFFNFRLDMDVDGVANRLIEMNSAPVPAGPRNPYGGAFTMQETTLASEKQAQRQLNMATGRKWIVVNPAVRNALGQPVGFALLPGENATPLLLPESWVRKRAGFLESQVWATPYSASENYAAGDYPYQSTAVDGLAKWTAADRPIDNRDLVLWYTMGITHNPRPEDWPVMPVHEAGFKLVPWGFFARNPALDLPVR